MSTKLTRALFIVTFVISALLRLGLSLVNREANDPHMEVVQYLLTHNSLPTKDDCWECFQPKLYHVLVAGVIKASGLNAPDTQIVLANLFSFTCGLLTLAVIWRFLIQLPLQNELLRWLAFAYVAFNPKLIGISSQATNDALLILFATLALHQTWLFLQTLNGPQTSPIHPSPKTLGGGKGAKPLLSTSGEGVGDEGLLHFTLLTLFTILAASTKTNGWVVFVAILTAVLLRAIFDLPNRLRLETHLLAYLLFVPVLVTLNPLNQYIFNYQNHGIPVMVNINPAPRPALFEQTRTNKPGLRSIADGFFTFRLASLLETPYINYDFDAPLLHRTSFWTQLYGRAHSVNFDNWPPTWNSENPSGFPLRRAIFMLALVPTAFLLVGAALAAWQLFRKNDQDSLFLLAFLGYLGFVVLYAFMYREYPVMKAVFTYPALIAFPVLFLAAAQKLPGWAIKTFTALSVVLFALYTADVLALTTRLYALL